MEKFKIKHDESDSEWIEEFNSEDEAYAKFEQNYDIDIEKASFIEEQEFELMKFCEHNIEAKDRLNFIISWRKEFINRIFKLAKEGIDSDGCVIPVQWFKDELRKLSKEKLIENEN